MTTHISIFDETDELCNCGNAYKMKGWRVCLECAETRMLYPDFWAELCPEPDQIEGEDGVPREVVINILRGDMRVVRRQLFGEEPMPEQRSSDAPMTQTRLF